MGCNLNGKTLDSKYYLHSQNINKIIYFFDLFIKKQVRTCLKNIFFHPDNSIIFWENDFYQKLEKILQTSKENHEEEENIWYLKWFDLTLRSR